jgi:tetratricopeptide (TPR) repeat protein
MRLAAGILMSACAIACREGVPADSLATGPVTFTRDVAPLVFQRCAPCHRPGESAPFSLLTYDDVKSRARVIAEVTGRRVMPPWLPVPGHGSFAGERRLSDHDIAVLRRWHEQGAAEGDAAHLPPQPVFPAGWQLGQPDLVVTLPRPYQLRADGTEVWRNFVMPVPVSSAQFVRAVELRPGNARVVHHAIMGVDQTRSSARRDAQDAEPGFEGMDLGDAQSPEGHLAGWTPGMAPVPAIEGSAWRLEPGNDLVLQLHMTPSGKPESVQPQVGLYFAQAPPTGPSLVLLRLDGDHQLDIPAGAREFVVTDRFELPVDVQVLAVYPHAHFLARTMEAHATLPDGREQPLIRIDSWDFKWQDVYRYAKPFRLPKGATIAFRYTYDNSAENPRNPSRPPKRVVAGMRSTDEMGRLQLQVRPDRAEDVATLRTAFYLQLVRKAPDDPWVHYELANLLRDSHRREDAAREYRRAIDLDPHHAAALTNLAVVLHEDGQIDVAMAYYRRALVAEPDFVPAHFNLANALRTQARTNDAVRHYREAVRLEPTMAAAHNNLGEVLAAQGHLDLALGHFRDAVRLSPRSATALGNLGAALGVAGRIDEAVPHLRQALLIDPGNEAARRNLELALERR